MTHLELVEGIKKKKKRALAKAISLTENQDPRSLEVIKDLYPFTGNTQYVGITGNPGAGKSSLVNALIKGYQERNLTVAVLAIDPASPITGGAILGDRIRIEDTLLNQNVFFRSISNRKHLGGLSATTFESLLLLDAFGFDVILIETVGTGQSETSIADLAHTNIVVTVPGLGDDVQAEKAGILEIGDIFVVNKSDIHGAQKAKKDLKVMLNLRSYEKNEWRPPVVLTQATNDKGVDELIDAIEKHFAYRRHHPKLGNYTKLIQQKTKAFVHQAIEAKIERLFSDMSKEVERMVNKEKSHIEIAETFAKQFLKSFHK